MSAAPFDSHAAIKRLTASGFDERQAEALVETLAMRQGDLVTKSDTATWRPSTISQNCARRPKRI